MQRNIWLWLSLLLLTLALAITIPLGVNSQRGQYHGIMANPRMMGNPGMMGDSAMAKDAQIIHQLFANHAQIHRTVTPLANGIQAVTESDNPQITALIQAHVASMVQRIAQHQPIPMIHIAPTVPTLAANADRYQRQLDNTAQGVTITETTEDLTLVKTIQDHAQEVTQFVEQGMPGIGRGGMMR